MPTPHYIYLNFTMHLYLFSLLILSIITCTENVLGRNSLYGQFPQEEHLHQLKSLTMYICVVLLYKGEKKREPILQQIMPPCSTD